MNEWDGLAQELAKLGDVNEMRLHPKPMMPKPMAAPPATFAVKQAFATSEFSGVMNPGSFPSASVIPPWREAPLRKQSGPPGDSAKLESSEGDGAPDGRAHEKKAALTPSSMRMLAGAGVGALGGAALGAGTAEQGQRTGGALKGGLIGGALGGAFGHVQPRFQSAMNAGMKPMEAAKAVASDVGVHAKARLGIKSPAHATAAYPAVPKPSGLNPTMLDTENSLKQFQELNEQTREAFQNSSLVRLGVPPHIAAQLGFASLGGQPESTRHVIESGVSKMVSNPFVRPAFSTNGGGVKVGAAPLTPAGRLESTQSVGMPRMNAPGPSIAQQSKPRGFGTPMPGLTKMALIERLIRLGATPIPGTPKLLMDERTPEQLSSLQRNVDDHWNQHVTEPLMRVAEPMLQHLPEGRMQGLARSGAQMVAQDPVGAVLSSAIPIPGAGAGYFAAKRGAERLIDRVAPLSG